MFSSTGLFKKIPCPKQDDCVLPNCIFSHAGGIPASTHGAGTESTEYDPASAGGDILPPATKRRRIQSPRPDETTESPRPLPEDHQEPRARRSKVLLNPREPGQRKAPLRAPQTSGPSGRPQSESVPSDKTTVAPRSAVRPISPAAIRHGPSRPPNAVQQSAKAEALTPRNVAKAPAVLKTRLTLLQALHQQLEKQNQKVAGGDEKWRPLVLSGPELIKFALDEEEDAATRLDQNIYRNTMAQKVLQWKKMSSEDWRAMVMKRTGDGVDHNTSGRHAEKEEVHRHLIPPSPHPVDLVLSCSERMAVLGQLRVPLEGLERFGYVTSRPSEREIEAAQAGVAAAGGFETCDRCGTRFQVFPGRDERGRLTTHGTCRYHWAKFNPTVKQKLDRVIGQSEATYSCCNRVQGSEGCTEAETHVFKVSDSKRLASILQFEQTPKTTDPPRRHVAVTFDCEMAYTTLGMEVIRVTALSWPQNQMLLDILVRPYGEILDLNTRFSGVSQDQYARAIPFTTDTTEEVDPKPLRKVESPAFARQLLFNLLTPEMPLIGHAIDNDLNTCRIIHPFVIDTVLLYPHPRGLPMRFGLKVLTQKYLGRSIQTAGEAGHDSREDAIATGDLVSVKVADKWRTMKHEGWRFEHGVLVAPDGRELQTML